MIPTLGFCPPPKFCGIVRAASVSVARPWSFSASALSVIRGEAIGPQPSELAQHEVASPAGYVREHRQRAEQRRYPEESHEGR